MAAFAGQVKVLVERDVEAALRAEADSRGIAVAKLVRECIDEHLAAKAAGQMLPEIEQRLAPIVEKVLARHVNRLAALASRSVIEAAWVKWLTVAIIERSAVRAKGAVPMYDDVDLVLEQTHQAAVRDSQRRGQPWDQPKPGDVEATEPEAPAPDAS